MTNIKVDSFTLNTNLIPALRREGIKFRYANGIYDPMKIIVTYKDADICMVEVIQDLCSSYCYTVHWHDSRDIICFPIKYIHYTVLINDIKKAINRLKNEGENKMNKKIYKVSGISYESNPWQMDEITFTVNVLGSHHAEREDCERIKDAIESIEIRDAIESAGVEQIYGVGRNSGRYSWRNEYQKERDKFEIKDVIFNNPATIVFWEDGTKTVVKAENEEFDPEKGLAMAIAKKALGNSYGYYDTFKKYVGKYEKKQKKGDK